MTRQPKDRHMTTPEPGLPHGRLTAEGVKLLTAGRSMLVLHAPAGPSSSRGDLFIFDHDAPEFEGRVCVRDCANGGPPETWHVNRFTYIGELQPDEFITAPVGGWVSNPVPGRTAETRHRGGDEYLGKEAWPTDEWFGGPGFWIHDGSFSDITAFRLTSAEAALPDAEQVKLLVDQEWLSRRVETDPDLPCEAGISALPASPSVPTGALADIAAERQRQASVEGWTAEHDDEHDHGEMAKAAACYAVGQIVSVVPRGDWAESGYRAAWPWDRSWWKPKDRRADLVRAGALIVAEIERLDRAEQVKT